MSNMGSGTGGRRARRRFSEEFKAGAVRLALDDGKSVGAVARELDLTESALSLWVRHAQAERTKGKSGLMKEEREELARLRKENRILAEERDILKNWSCVRPHPRRDESGSVCVASEPGQGRRLLVPRGAEKNGPECRASGTPYCCPFSPGDSGARQVNSHPVALPGASR